MKSKKIELHEHHDEDDQYKEAIDGKCFVCVFDDFNYKIEQLEKKLEEAEEREDQNKRKWDNHEC
jgi:hypothetical protein